MWTLMESPVGELRIVARDGAITAIDFIGGFSASDAEQSSTVAAMARAGRPLGERDDADPVLVAAVRQLEEYFAGDRTDFDLPLAPEGTPFQRKVWEQLLKIGYGESASYGEIAGRLGMTGHGARAVGLANGRNPIPIVIPCHRVVGADGSLTGYGGGIERKQILLDLETGSLF
ncbi:MAG: methylated-DNA--[protein]-cysteine S-methyltransferase [Nocardioidaceae bacterium]